MVNKTPGVVNRTGQRLTDLALARPDKSKHLFPVSVWSDPCSNLTVQIWTAIQQKHWCTVFWNVEVIVPAVCFHLIWTISHNKHASITPRLFKVSDRFDMTLYSFSGLRMGAITSFQKFQKANVSVIRTLIRHNNGKHFFWICRCFKLIVKHTCITYYQLIWLVLGFGFWYVKEKRKWDFVEFCQ